MGWWKRKRRDGQMPVVAAQAGAPAVQEAAIPKAAGLPGPEELVVWAADYKKRLGKTATFGEMRELWKSNAFPYRLRNVDPYSDSYRAEVLDIYQRLVNETYDIRNEMTSTHLSPEDFARGYPWISGNLEVVAAEMGKAVQGIRTVGQHCPGARSLIEFGVGWGNSAIPLARAGLSVCAVDIDGAFLDRVAREAAALATEVRTVHADFLDAARNPDQRYDVVLFSSSFHHCLEFAELLRLVRDNVLTENGCILFFAEPISNGFTFPWGLRYDGEALWAITCNKWLELGFSEDFFRELMRRSGYALQEVPDPSGTMGPGWVARPIW